MKKKNKSFWAGIGLGLGAAGVFGARHFLSKILVNFALDREMPKQPIATKKRVNPKKNPIISSDEIKVLSENLQSNVSETVEITAYDGINLVGHIRHCENPKRIIVAMHGWRSSWDHDFGGITDFWHENNCTVLFAEQRGQNASGGDYMGFGIIERYDCLEWVKFIDEKFNSRLPIYLVGISMGASTVLMTSALDLPASVRGIVADCGFTSPRDIWKHVVEKNFHIPYGFISSNIDKAYKEIADAESNYSCEDALKDCKVPVWFIHGTNDDFVPIEMTYRNYLACPTEKELMVVPGADHGTSYLHETEKYHEIAKRFWAKCENK